MAVRAPCRVPVVRRGPRRIQLEAVLEARAAAALDSNAQHGCSGVRHVRPRGAAGRAARVHAVFTDELA
jgi:hypothetical protein